MRGYMDWIKEKLWELNDVFDAFPKVYWLIMFYMALAVMAIFMYVPFFGSLENFNLLGVIPLKQIILENWSVLQWGVIVVPVVILLIGWVHAADLYARLLRKRYGYR